MNLLLLLLLPILLVAFVNDPAVDIPSTIRR
jgi:hypothetical protein